MNPPITFSRQTKEDWNALFRNLDEVNRDIYRVLSGAGSLNITVVTGGSSGGGGSATATEYRAGRATVSSGAVSVSFVSSMPSTDYELFLTFKRTDRGSYQELDAVAATKTISGFSTTVNGNGTLVYLAIARK